MFIMPEYTHKKSEITIRPEKHKSKSIQIHFNMKADNHIYANDILNYMVL